MKIVAIIPARSGSKSIKNKNIRKINGKPLLTYSIETGLESSLIDRVIVSTDSKVYQRIARLYGAEVPFLRPDEFSGDYATDLQVFKHALDWFSENEQYTPDICVHLRPTYPVRNVNDLDTMIKILIENTNLDSVRSISVSQETPYKMWYRDKEGLIKPVINSEIREAYNEPRQSLPVIYIQNASIDVIRAKTIIDRNSMSGDNIYGYLMDHNWDIDQIKQLKDARHKIRYDGKN